ncbi:right-handed parallel beta-helix repeat-containing protein [Planctomycetota bacterium]
MSGKGRLKWFLVLSLMMGGSLGPSLLATSFTSSRLISLDDYRDDFTTDKVSQDAYTRSKFWIKGAASPNEPHVMLSSNKQDLDRGLLFRGHGSRAAELAYRLPVLPDSRWAPSAMVVNFRLDVQFVSSDNPWNPVVGHLTYQMSSDGLNWSTPQGLRPGANQLSIQPLSGPGYIRFLGDHVIIDNVQVGLYMAFDIQVPGDFQFIQDAIDFAGNGDVIAVADGLYRGARNSALNFYGKKLTLISENGPQACIIDSDGETRGVVFQSGETRETALVGFTIRNGWAKQGGGIYIDHSSPTIAQCVVSQCVCEVFGSDLAQGGGIYCQGGSPRIVDCQITSNRAESGQSESQGGGLFLENSSAWVENCHIRGNLANENSPETSGGGGVFLQGDPMEQQYPHLRNCVIVENVTSGFGAGLYANGAYVEIINCTVAANRADESGGGCYFNSAFKNDASVRISSSILWQNQPNEIVQNGMSGTRELEVSYSTVQGGWQGAGIGNEAVDPCFINPGQHDYHLPSFAGRWDPADRAWVHDMQVSRCLDRGDPTVPTQLEHRPHGDRINRGAYGGTAQASKGAGPLVLHVDGQNGDDGNIGLSRETALASIQLGIDLATDGDAVLVWPGTYYEEVVIKSKAITVQSAADAAVISATNYALTLFEYPGTRLLVRNFVLRDCQEAGVLCHIASPVLSHLTIKDNAIGILAFDSPYMEVSNCVLWDNTYGDLRGCRAQYSCIEQSDDGQQEGVGNISRKPRFADPNGGDFHLQSPFGRYWPNHQVWVVDDYLSPCIDRGDPSVYPFEEPQNNGARLNMGAYGGTGFASRSNSSGSPDLNYDGIVDFRDFAIMADRWLAEI